MTMHFPTSTSSLAQPVTHGGASFESAAEIIRPLYFVPTVVIGKTAQVDELLTVPFMSDPGAYIFLQFPRSALDPVRVRIGEGASVAARLEGKRDEWVAAGFDLAIVVTCSHPRFDKECAEALEARITAKIEGERSAEVQRERAPKVRRLSPEAQRALDGLFGQLQVELEKRRILLLSSGSPSTFAGVSTGIGTPERLESADVLAGPSPPRTDLSSGCDLALHYLDLTGRLIEMPDHVVIKRGTEVSRHEVAALQTASRKARRELVEARVIVPHPTKPDRMIFAEDHRLGSLTTASRICTGSTQSGTHVWRPRRYGSI